MIMYAICKTEAWQVIGFNKDGTQQILCRARTIDKLITKYAVEVARMVSTGENNILPSFTNIRVWNVEQGFTGLDLPYIKQG